MSINFSEYRNSFGKLLQNVSVDKISSDIYCKNYLTYLLKHKAYYLKIYSDVLDKLLKHSRKNENEISLIDYGAGNGLLGLFAKHCGFKQVHINDKDEKFIDAARSLALQLNIKVDSFIHGDESSLHILTDTKPDAIIGTDVIEHIYNLTDFFETIKNLNQDMVSVFTTGSNPLNPIKVKKLQKLQVKDEYEGATDEETLFGTESHLPYLTMRKDIIREHFQLSEDKVSALASATRGLIMNDIIIVVKRFVTTGKIPKLTVDSTNTCNPYTGSWTERILTINQYRAIFNSAGFKLNLYTGFYDVNRGLAKNMINFFLNIGTSVFGFSWAPFIVLTGSAK